MRSSGVLELKELNGSGSADTMAKYFNVIEMCILLNLKLLESGCEGLCVGVSKSHRGAMYVRANQSEVFGSYGFER